MIDDVKRRAPYYLSDWTDAWDYRVVPATIYMYFAKYVIRITIHYNLTPYQFLLAHAVEFFSSAPIS